MTARKRVSPNINLNLNVRGLKQSATLTINEKSAHLMREGKKVFRFGLGQSPFPVPQPVIDELRANAHQKDYLPVRGLPGLREAVSGYHRRMHGIERAGDDVLIGPGSKELMFILQLVYYGDLVIPTPSWVSYAPQARIVGRQIHWVPTQRDNDWRMMPGDLDRVCQDDPGRPRIVILNYPSNPTGDSYSIEELKALARVAKKHKVILVSDEIYGELHHRGQHVSIARYYPEGTIISGGLSKWCGAGGWRLGTFTFPHTLRWLLDAMSTVASETYTSTSAPIQYAAIRAFEGGTEMESYLVQSRRVLRHLGRHVWHCLRDAGAEVSAPVGGFYLFPDFSLLSERFARHGITNSVQLCERLLDETGVATLPGADFGRPLAELTLRLAYVDFDGARILSAAQQVPLEQELDQSFLEMYCPNVTQGADAMCRWINKMN